MTSETFARSIRSSALEMVHRTKSSHIGSCLSAADIVAVLYNDVMRLDPLNPKWEQRDRFIISKGHAAAIIYAALAERGFFSKDWLKEYSFNGSPLAGHVTHCKVPGIEASSGSLGHGLSLGCGMALAARQAKADWRVYVLLSDGECDEGSVWEAALFAPFHNITNLTAVIDYNKLQGFGRTAEVLDLEPFGDKWRAFGWDVVEVDGHDHAALKLELNKRSSKPRLIIAHTVKGKGVSFMEDDLAWHYKSPNAEQLASALAELKVP